VLWPSISYAGGAIVFERDFNIFRFDLKTNAAAPVTVALRGVAAGPAVEHRTFTSNVDDLSVSHDGKKVAFIVRGEVFAAPASDATNARRITNSATEESQVSWSPDGRKLVGEPTSGWIIYTSNNDLIDGTIFRLPFITITTEKGEPMELHPRPVDVPVTRAFGEDAAGTDSQLDAAVRVLMKE